MCGGRFSFQYLGMELEWLSASSTSWRTMSMANFNIKGFTLLSSFRISFSNFNFKNSHNPYRSVYCCQLHSFTWTRAFVVFISWWVKWILLALIIWFHPDSEIICSFLFFLHVIVCFHHHRKSFVGCSWFEFYLEKGLTIFTKLQRRVGKTYIQNLNLQIISIFMWSFNSDSFFTLFLLSH